MKKYIIVIFGMLLLAMLIFIWRVDDQDLGNSYYYLPKHEAIDVGYPGGAIIYKSAKKYLYSEIKIHGDVISVDHNKDFIIALQKVNGLHIENADSSISKDSLRYFIVVKKSDSVYGPFSKIRYLQKREALNVSKGLTLKE